MKNKTDIYHRWVAWSDEDQAYIGRCPDLFNGGVHGHDALKVAKDLQQVIDEWEQILESGSRPLPPVRVKPMVEFDHYMVTPREGEVSLAGCVPRLRAAHPGG